MKIAVVGGGLAGLCAALDFSDAGHEVSVFEKYPSYTNGTSEQLFQTGLCLPSGSNMTEEDLERVKAQFLRSKLGV